ncbi:MAG: DUF2298 domain-containing protein [Candidatus Woesebacteria bacterium]|jgi:uncharacterized membrane protein
MLEHLNLIFYSWILIFFWQVLAAPFLIVTFRKKFVDAAWGFGRIVSWLVLASVIWFLAHLTLAVNTRLFLWILFAVLSVLSYYFFRRHRREIIDFLKKRKKLLIIEEIIFLFGFLFLTTIRSFKPDILDLEKFMDFGFIMSYLKSSTLPAMDMWLAGEKINYYTFGHFLGAIASNFWGIEPSVSYNLLLALLMGLTLIESFSLIVNLIGPFLARKKNLKLLVVPALVATFLIGFGANTHTIWYFLEHHSFKAYWYPDATRFIERTIHEFPTYSFVVSDLHAHVWSLPIVFFLLLNIYFWLINLLAEYKKEINFKVKYFLPSIVVGFILGLIVATSAWDTAIYSMVLGLIGIILLFFNYRFFLPLVFSALTMIAMLLLASSPWWLNFVSISEGIKIAKEQSPLWQLIVLWIGHVTMSAVAAIFISKRLFKGKQLRNKANHLLVLALIITAWFLLIIPELIYVKDIYPNHPRANTMFKLTFQSITLMNLSIAYLIALFSPDFFAEKRSVLMKLLMKKRRLSRKKRQIVISRALLKTCFLIFIFAVGIYPFFAYRDYYGIRLKISRSLDQRTWILKKQTKGEYLFGDKDHLVINIKADYKGLDGAQWLKEQYPDDYAAIKWMNENVKGRPVIIEAVGESYTSFDRVSTFTGLPTVLGWRVHEWLWRGGFDIPSQRTEEVRKVYEVPLSLESRKILNKYKVEYIFVGDKEKEAYKNIDLIGLKELGNIVFRKGNTLIIKR